jgi:hypothetical protein
VVFLLYNVNLVQQDATIQDKAIIISNQSEVHVVTKPSISKLSQNQLIRDLFNQPEIGRRLNRMWPEDLIDKLQRTIDGWYLLQIFTTIPFLITLFKYLE